MKKLILLLTVSLMLLSSCNLEEKFDTLVNSAIPTPTFEQEISEEFTINGTDLSVAGEISDETVVDINEIKNKIDNFEEIILEDIEISLAEDSEQPNFDFLDSLSLTLTSDENVDPIIIDFGEIEKGLTTLSLPEGANTNILALIEGSNNQELTITMNLVTNTALENDLEIELISTLLGGIDIGL